MNALAWLLSMLGGLCLCLTVLTATRGANRHRDTRRLDILLAVGGLFLTSSMLGGLWRGHLAVVPPAIGVFFPYFLLRLIQHFREVRRAAVAISLTTPVFLTALLVVTPPPSPLWLSLFVSTYSVLGLLLAAACFSYESRRSGGVTARRLVLAAAGTWCLMGVHLVVGGTLFLQIASELAAHLNRALSGLALIAFYLAFATPRWLRKSWQRDELGRYLVDTADREAEERGRHAAADLLRAAQRGAAGSAVFVAIRDSVTSEDVTVRAATNRSLEGTVLDAEAGPADIAFRVAESSIVPLSALDGRLRDGLTRTGTSVLLAPISSSVRRWGVVGVVQRHGSLFPSDDLRLLEQLGLYAGGILDHGQLVTEARERERRASDRRLREVEQRMSLMLDTITDYAILIVDHHGHIVNWPVGAGAVFGYAEADVVDTPAARLFGMSEDVFLGVLAEAARAGGVMREHEGTRHDGTKFIALSHIRRLEPGPDDLQGFVAVTRDVTERRELEERLRQGQKMEALGRLAGGIAHDFNNLLTAILGYADCLDNDLPAGDTERRDYVQEIQKAATRAAGLTRQLLAFSRHQVVQPTVIDLAAAIDELMPMLRRLIGEHIDTVGETVGSIPPVLADRSQMEQVLLNLAVNARDAMPKGGRLLVRLSLHVAETPRNASGLGAGEWVRLDVQDTGIGMDAATRARIFEPFFTTKEFGRGTGLGLATVYGIIRQMGGVISVDSAPNEGSTFSVFLRPTKLLAVEAGVVSEAAAPGGSEVLLLVEDEPGVAKLLQQMLQRHGYQLLVADNAARALEIAASAERIDMVISDVVMPGGSGPAMVQELRVARPGLRTLFISGYADGVLSSEGLPPDAHFLQKPFTAIDLLIKLRHILTGQR